MNEQEVPTGNIRIESKDWLFNAGLIGLYRILKNAGKDVSFKENYLEFAISCFAGFDDLYFSYFIDTYSRYGPWQKLVEYYRANFDPESKGEPDEEKIKEFIKVFEKDIDKASYRSAYAIVAGDEDYMRTRLKEIKDKALPAAEKLVRIRDIYDFYQEYQKIIQAKYISYEVINHYWSGKSFLNKQQVKLNMYDIYRQDFSNPVTGFLQTESKKNPFASCLVCRRDIPKKGDAEGLSWINMDLDSARKTSIYWNHNSDILVCPPCRLVYSCVPAGFTTYKGRGIFINDNSGIDRLIQMNNLLVSRLGDIENARTLENLTYTQIITMIRQMREQHLKREIDNIQVIKYDNNKKAYSFNLLSKQVLKVIGDAQKELDTLSGLYDVFIDKKNKINLYEEVIDHIYRNIDLYPLVYTLLGLSLQKKGKHGFAGLIFKINMKFIGGVMSEKKINVMKFMGLKLKKGYQDEQNKIPGIAYRLLNNLKTKNINGFMDVVINCHMHIGLEVPTLFIECIDNVEQFQAYGYAFLIGFMGQEYVPGAKTETQGEGN